MVWCFLLGQVKILNPTSSQFLIHRNLDLTCVSLGTRPTNTGTRSVLLKRLLLKREDFESYYYRLRQTIPLIYS